MTDLRIWSTLTPAERAQAIETAKGIVAAGETRWHVVARLCGIKGGIPLRTALDEGWRAKKRAADNERYKREHGNRSKTSIIKTDRQQQTSRERGQVRATIASMVASQAQAPITLPRVQFLEM